MSQEYDNTNRGAIWRNKKKETDKHSDFIGTLNVEGVEYWVSGWKRKPDANENAPALSFSIKRKEEKQAVKPKVSKPADSFANDIPF